MSEGMETAWSDDKMLLDRLPPLIWTAGAHKMDLKRFSNELSGGASALEPVQSAYYRIPAIDANLAQSTLSADAKAELTQSAYYCIPAADLNFDSSILSAMECPRSLS
nr:hypothetical protein [Candidatus Hydrogenedentota bacterium]